MRIGHLIPALAVVGLAASPLAADLITNLTIVNDAALPDGPTYATVNVKALALNQVQFSVDANGALLGAGTNFGIQVFGFNYDAAATGALTPILPAGWSYSTNSNISSFGTFEIDTAGTGGTRQDPLVFTVTTANNFGSNAALEAAFFEANTDGFHYVAHIAGFTNYGRVNSAFFSDGGSPVPEPATLALIGIGLAGLGLARRKRG